MERMIPLEKMSKKAKRAYYAARRGTWGEMCIRDSNGDTGQLLEEGLAIPMAAIFRQDKQILQIDAGASKKR